MGSNAPVWLVAEMSANHGGDFARAVRILEAAARAGADAVKLQTYTADTLTIACDNDYFRIKGTLWEGRTLHDLYREAAMPMEWTPGLIQAGRDLGVAVFSTPFDPSAVDYLESLDVPAHKVASFEIVDIPLLRKIGATGKPVIMSTGMATPEEIDEAVETLRASGCRDLALLKCTSAYPSPPEAMNLRAIPLLAQRYGVPAGLSDHTLGTAAAVAAVALGACIIEKHFTLARADGGPDSAFSLEPHEFAAMVRDVQEAHAALGRPVLEPCEKELASRVFRRSLFVVRDVARGEPFTPDNVRSIRPGHGMHPRHLDEVLGRRAAKDIPRGTPLAPEHIEGDRS
ncbi:pseudaminic acid synthase [Fundidesulfovibrio magnetotacticus]|uniref:pseudaminic acid synthase n=1 Tax=Fundidesulfovibrio magnetotacticus TaxID=2730080 RepID=UPI001F220932|nr:pseudaminic acid synthase [Fundidesulfovibrio magnetotacticus]